MLLGDDGDAEGLGLRGLRSRAGSRDDERSLLRDGTRGLAAARRDRFLGSLAVVAGHRTRDDDGESREHVRGCLRRLVGHAHARSRPRLQHLQVPVDREPVAQGASDFLAHSLDGGELLDRGGAQGVHRSEGIRERAGRRGADVADGQGDEDAREGLALGLVQLGEHFLGALGGGRLDGLEDGLAA